MQRGQHPLRVLPRQFGYPLSFRGQVCGTQSSLPCFSSMVLYAWRLPSLQRVPVGPVPRLQQYYEAATTSRPACPSAYVFASGFRAVPEPLCPPWRSRRRQAGRRAGSLGQPVLQIRQFPHGQERDLSGSQATRPAPLPCSQTPADPVFLAIAAFPVLPPRPTTRRLRHLMISRLPQGFSARCLRFTSGVAATHARLASGWRAPPLPGGCRTLWVTMKGFRPFGILLSRAYPDAS
jgi:hypothetical protein